MSILSPAAIDPPVAAALPAVVAATVLPAVVVLLVPAVDATIVDVAAPPTAAVLAIVFYVY